MRPAVFSASSDASHAGTRSGSVMAAVPRAASSCRASV
jgi:hypothetical protein